MELDFDLGDTRVIIAECKSQGLLRNEVAYVLATAYHETNFTMKPVREAYWLSEGWRRRNLRYWPWYGRGYVQITWEENYIRAGKELGLDLTTDPDVVMKSCVSTKVLVTGMVEGWFTTHKLSDYITLQRSDFKGARRIINGTDDDDEIADHAKNYDIELKEVLGYGE
jgi:putative chitinase